MEGYAAYREVNAMLGLVKQETERVESHFLEPAYGVGNYSPAINIKTNGLDNLYKQLK
jgi:hypothetical protein